jgi:outer membrane protein TolC
MNLVQADARLARAQVTPPLGVGVTFAREGTGEQLFVGVLSFPVPILDPSRFDAARHDASIAAAKANAERIDLELARDVALALHEREHTREVRTTLSTKVLASLRESVRLAGAGYQAGTQDATGFLLVRQRLVAAEEQLVRASADVQRADLHYALASGTLLAEVPR